MTRRDRVLQFARRREIGTLFPSGNPYQPEQGIRCSTPGCAVNLRPEQLGVCGGCGRRFCSCCLECVGEERKLTCAGCRARVAA
jgi:hypothetical protein